MRRVDWVIVGLLGGALTSTSFVPQIIKGWRTRSLTDVSPLMLGSMFAGLVLWEVYGWAIRDAAVIVANAVGLVFTGTLLVLWYRFGRVATSAPLESK